MRARIGIVAVALTLASCGSSDAGTTSSHTPGPPAGAGVPCGPAQGHTLAQSQLARIYSSGKRVYGCSRGQSQVYRLGQSASCLGASRVFPAAVVGTLAAYGSERCGVDTGSSQVIVRRLTDGQTLYTRPAITGPLGPEAYQTVQSLVLKRDGATAWIATGSSIGRHTHAIEVHAQDASGFRLLDSGAAIAPASLRLAGSKLSWRNGGQTRGARLA